MDEPNEDKLIEAIEGIRRDKKDPWRYLLFTFINGIAQGLGMALGMTLVLGIVIYILTMFVSQMVNFPVVGRYFTDILNMIELYVKSAPKVH